MFYFKNGDKICIGFNHTELTICCVDHDVYQLINTKDGNRWSDRCVETKQLNLSHIKEMLGNNKKIYSVNGQTFDETEDFNIKLGDKFKLSNHKDESLWRNIVIISHRGKFCLLVTGSCFSGEIHRTLNVIKEVESNEHVDLRDLLVLTRWEIERI